MAEAKRKSLLSHVAVSDEPVLPPAPFWLQRHPLMLPYDTPKEPWFKTEGSTS